MIVSHYIIYTNHFDRTGIKATICKIYNFSIVTSICHKYYCAQVSCTKNSWGEISFSEFNTEKVKFLLILQPKLFTLALLTMDIAQEVA